MLRKMDRLAVLISKERKEKKVKDGGIGKKRKKL